MCCVAVLQCLLCVMYVLLFPQGVELAKPKAAEDAFALPEVSALRVR